MRINPDVIFRDEADLGGILFNSSNGGAFGLNPVGAFIYGHLAAGATIREIQDSLKAQFHNIPPDTNEHIGAFMQELLEKGFLLEDQ